MSSNKTSLFFSIVALATMAVYSLWPGYGADWISVLTGPVYLVLMTVAGVVGVRRGSAGPIATAALVRVAIEAVIGGLDRAELRFVPGSWGREIALAVLLFGAALPLLLRRRHPMPVPPRLAMPVLALLAVAGVVCAVAQMVPPRWGWKWIQIDPPNGRAESAVVLEALEAAPGMKVAEIGARGGYYTFRIAEAVGPEGRVIAYDTDFDMVSLIWARALRLRVGNVDVHHTYGEGFGLHAEQVDRILIVNAYALTTCAEDPTVDAILGRLADVLVPGGKLVLYVDWILEWPERDCRQLTSDELVAAAAPRLSPVRLEPAVNESPEHERGYLIVLEKPLEG